MDLGERFPLHALPLLFGEFNVLAIVGSFLQEPFRVMPSSSARLRSLASSSGWIVILMGGPLRVVVSLRLFYAARGELSSGLGTEA